MPSLATVFVCSPWQLSGDSTPAKMSQMAPRGERRRASEKSAVRGKIVPVFDVATSSYYMELS